MSMSSPDYSILNIVIYTGIGVLMLIVFSICMLVIVRSGISGVCTVYCLCLLVVVFVCFCYFVVVVCYCF